MPKSRPIKEQLQQLVYKAVCKVAGVCVPAKNIKIEHPEVEEHGDYSTNIALEIFKIQDSRFNSFKGLAEKIVAEILNSQFSILNSIQVAGPGFINFSLTLEFLINQLELANKEEFGKGNQLQGKKIMVEFTDPNPFKEFHIGHLYSNIVGETLSRLFEFQGANVWRVNYQGDVGMHVAKSVWGMTQLLDQTPDESATLSEKASFLGKAYALGATKFEEDEQAKTEITALNSKIYARDPEVVDVYDKGKRWSLEYFDMLYEKLGTKFKRFYFESEAGVVGLELVKEHLKSGIFELSDGAIVFKGEEYGLHTRVFVNSQGLPTYEAKDLGLAPTKYKDFPYDLSIIVTGNEVNQYFKVVLTALNKINPELGQKAMHLSHGMVRLPSGKMSSRTGKVITGEWLINEAVDSVRKIAPQTDAADKIGLAAIRYALLKTGLGNDIEFDFGESVNFEGNSGPYLQYTYARTRSVLGKVKSPEFIVHRNISELKTHNHELSSEELSVLRWIYRYGEVVEEAASRYAPNLVCNFLYELAQRYNTFYSKYSILSAQYSGQRDFRLALTKAVGSVLKSGLNLLGIEALEHM